MFVIGNTPATYYSTPIKQSCKGWEHCIAQHVQEGAVRSEEVTREISHGYADRRVLECGSPSLFVLLARVILNSHQLRIVIGTCGLRVCRRGRNNSQPNQWRLFFFLVQPD
jgi:hypothetical protein